MRFSQRASVAPTIRPFMLPNNRPNLYDYDHVLPVGDSLIQQFLEPLGISSSNIGRPLNTKTVQHWKDYIFNRYGKAGRLRSNRTALLLGSAVWDLLEEQATDGNDIWEDHGRAWQELIAFIRSNYPRVTILWKSPTALHIHVPMIQVQQGNTSRLERQFGKQKFYDRLKYMSTSRAYELYLVQKELCIQYGVTFLDVYGASYLAADETKIGDGRHFTPRLNTEIINWFVNGSHIERIWR